MPWPLSLPVLLILVWGIAGLLWWDRRGGVITRPMQPWVMAALALITLAMALTIASLPAPLFEQGVRVFLGLEAAFGVNVLARRTPIR